MDYIFHQLSLIIFLNLINVSLFGDNFFHSIKMPTISTEQLMNLMD